MSTLHRSIFGTLRRNFSGDIPRRPVQALAIAGLLGSAACMPAVQQGGLTPRGMRTSNEVIAVDLQVMDSWERRITEARAREVKEAVPGARDYAAARAVAWMNFARDEYAAEPSGPVADAAFTHARSIIEEFERDSIAAAPQATSIGPVTGTRMVREDLWSRVSRMKADPSFPAIASEVAELEVALVRAGRARDAAHPSCQAATQLARAERLLGRTEQRLAELNAPPIIVAKVDSTPVVPAGPVVPPNRPVVVSVHFALNADSLTAKSRFRLDEVARAMASHDDLAVALEGHADPRGKKAYNLDLSRRRAARVREYLVSRGLDSTRVTITARGSELRAASGASALDFALDRRVTVQFLTPEGSAMTEESRPRDLQLEEIRTPSGSRSIQVRKTGRDAAPASRKKSGKAGKGGSKSNGAES